MKTIIDEEELISIVIPIYNVSQYLDRCISSIVKQTYRNLEILLIDDGSTDGSSAICDAWKERDNRIVVIHKSNGGVASARNAGIENATGTYIGFVDSDDYVDEDMYSYLYRFASIKYIPVCLYTKKNNADIEMKKEVVFMDSMQAILYNLDEEVEKLRFNKELRYGSFLWNKLFPAHFFTNNKFSVGKTYEDVAMIFQLYKQAEKVVFLPECKYHYIERQNSIVMSKDVVREDYMSALLCQKKQLKEMDLFEKVKAKYNTIYLYGCLQMIRECVFSSSPNKMKLIKQKYQNELLKAKDVNAMSLPKSFWGKFYLLSYTPVLYRLLYWLRERRRGSL